MVAPFTDTSQYLFQNTLYGRGTQSLSDCVYRARPSLIFTIYNFNKFRSINSYPKKKKNNSKNLRLTMYLNDYTHSNCISLPLACFTHIEYFFMALYKMFKGCSNFIIQKIKTEQLVLQIQSYVSLNRMT